MSNRESMDRIVWIPDEDNPRIGHMGEIVGSMGAFYTTIRYESGGIEFEVLMENEEFQLLGELIEYDND